ncbi:MAG: helix-turn-helix transcriptional regulator, partial [Rhizobiaceae bacterium]
MNHQTPIASNLRTAAAASYLGLSVSALAKMRMRGDGPRFIKLGRRLVIYRLSDLSAWME